MRKMMTKEVTKTTCKVAKLVIENGVPVAEQLEDQTLLGNVSIEKAQKLISKKLGEGVTVLEVSPETVTYELAVEEFIEVASIKVATEDEQPVAENTQA